MRAKVVVDNEENYEKWLEQQETFSDFIATLNGKEIKKIKLAKINNLNE
jgi:heme/copper-type cytochrome/quinol oxidase subunit 2